MEEPEAAGAPQSQQWTVAWEPPAAAPRAHARRQDDGGTDAEPVGDARPVAAVLQLQLFAPHPTLDFGSLAVGGHKTLYLRAENATLLTQRGRAARELGPAAAGAVSKLVVLKLDGKHRLQVKLLGKAAAPQRRRPGDQALRGAAHARGSDAPPSPRGAKAGAGPGARPPPAAGGPPRGPAAAAKPGGDQAPGGFKVPPRRSAAVGSSLRLKPPGAAAAAGARPPSAAPRGADAAARRPAQRAGAGAGPLSPASPPARARAPGELGSPGGEGSVRSLALTAGGRPAAKGAASRSGRPASAAGGAAKVPSSARKTFRFFHTELWMGKQDRAFTGWLNHLLLPYTPEYLRAASEGDTSAALTDLRLAARVKGAMLAAYRRVLGDPEVRETMMRVEACIDAGKLRMKPELVLLEDLVQRAAVLDVLMSYNPFWLRVAVEVVTQRPLHPGGGGSGPGAAAGEAPGTPGAPPRRAPGFSEAMRAFLTAHFLGDRDMAAEAEAGRGAAHFNTERYLAELGTLVLKRFLLLVLLLDRAATHLAGPLRTPLLFRLAGSIKSSKQVRRRRRRRRARRAAAGPDPRRRRTAPAAPGAPGARRQAVMEFLHGRLVGEGNVGRHLELLGYRLAYSQSPLMEYPFAVTNLAVDLRDGLRLIKVAEALTGDESLLPQARFPSERRPMQLHNTGLALSALAGAGVPLGAVPSSTGLLAVKPEAIVDGDREATLALLWAIARTLQLGAVLRPGTLRAEVQRVLARACAAPPPPLLPGCAGARAPGGGAAAVPLAVYMHDELLSALMEWVQAVARAHGVAVHNFTSCFADGVVLCLLVHYYLPNAVDLAAVHIPRQRRQEAAAAAAPPPARDDDTPADAGDGASSAAGSAGAAAPGAPGTWRGDDGAAPDAAAALGGVPEMLSARDWTAHGPDERAVILYAAFLGARLLECSRDDRAAHIIQSAWRGARTKTAGMARAHLNRWVAAAAVIQRGVRAWLLRRRLAEWLAAQRGAALALQAAWHGRAARGELAAQAAAAGAIQRAWRGVRAARAARQQQAALMIQACWRAHVARAANTRMVALLERGLVACRALKLARQEKREAATALQAAWRGRTARAELLAARGAAVVLQAAWRGRQARLRLRQQRAAALALQAAWRGRALRQQHRRVCEAGLALQAAWQGFKVRQAVRQSHAFATFLQACCRCRRDRAAFLAARRAAVALQAAARGAAARRRLQQLQAARRALQEQRAAATAIAAAWRGRAARRTFARQRSAALTIQAAWRGAAARGGVRRQAAAATTIAAAWRARAARVRLAQLRAAAVRLQALVRMRQAQAALQRQRAAAVALQAAWRARDARAQLAAHRAAATIQAHWRRHMAQRELRRAVRAATVIQSCWRCHVWSAARADATAAAVALQAAARGRAARTAYARQRGAAVALQAATRGWLARRELGRQRDAAVAIQAAWRRHAARQRFVEARRAAVLVQAAWRRHAARASFLRQRAAAVALQAAARGRAARAELAAARRAAVALQAAARGWLARCALARQRAAATAIQAAVRRRQAQARLAEARSAAVAIQAAWRGAAARAELGRQRSAAVAIQAAWRRHAARQRFVEARRAAVLVQVAWRRHAARASFLRQRDAAVALQAAARGRAARAALALRQTTAAAVALQAAWRGRRVRAEAARRAAAAAVIQRCARGMQGRKQARMRREYVRTAGELQKMLLMLHTRSRAATTIQAAWRGWRQRAAFAPVWHAHRTLTAAGVLQRAWRCARARAELPRLRAELPRRRAVAAWRRALAAARAHLAEQRAEAARREAAALVIQSAVRGWQVRRVTSRQLAGVRRFQALWRGHRVRKTCGRASRDARRRIAAVSAAAASAPQRRIGVRTREALDVLLASRQCSQVITAVAAIEFSTRYSRACCALMVDAGGVAALLSFMASCNRSRPHVEMLGHALACLANIARWPELLPGVLTAPDCVMVLSERLQMFRDTEDIFMATVAILACLVRSDEGALEAARRAPGAVKLWEGVAQLLARKMDMERRYIERLEGQKGSDVTAREATRKLVSAATQLDALQQVLARVECVAAAHGLELPRLARPGQPGGGHGGSGGGAGEAREGEELVPRNPAAIAAPNHWQPKNTIVRGAFRESVATRAHAAAAASAAAAAAAAAAAPAAGGDAGARGVAGPDVLLAAVQKLGSADQELRGSDQSHKQSRAR
ncbi:Aspm [Scenedesmus sp. PABB004]|nr:Aspm [Scenedesmus sp. PABB004]